MIKKFLLYLSAFIPLYALLLIKIIIELLTGNLHMNVLNTLLIILLWVLIGLGVLGVGLSLGKGESKKIKVVSATNITEKHFLGYFSLFVLFALSYEIEYVSMAVVFVLILVLIGIVYIRNNLFYINPLLNLLGYSFYSVEYEVDDGKVLTKTMFFHGKLVEGQLCSAYITDYNFNLIK